MPELHPLRRRRFAKHEIGHVILFLWFHVLFKDVEIISETDHVLAGASVNPAVAFLGSATGVVRGYGVGMSNRERVIVCMAGVAGERVNRKKAGHLTVADVLAGAANDWDQAKAICTPAHLKVWGYGRSSTHVGTYMNECLAVAHGIITQFKDVHSHLVELLLEKGKLTYQECKEVWDAQSRLGMDKLATSGGKNTNQAEQGKTGRDEPAQTD